MTQVVLNAFVLLLILPFTAFAKPRTYAEILKSKELRICYVAWLGADTLEGYPSPYLDMALSFAKKKNLTPKVEKILWEEQFQNSNKKVIQGQVYTPFLFENQKCDFFASDISPFEWRKKLMDLNWIYISSMMVVVRKSEKKNYNTVNDLKGKKVKVNPNTTYHEWLLEFQKTLKNSEKVNIIELTQGGSISQLLNKSSDFIILSSHQAMYSKLHLSNDLAIAFPIGKPVESGWGFPKENIELKNETVNFFETSRNASDSEVNAIYKKYFGITLNEYDNLQYLVTTNQ